MARRKDTKGLKLVTEKAQDVGKQFRELFDKTNRKDARPSDVDALRGLLADNRGGELWRQVQGPMAVAETLAVENFGGVTPGAAQVWRARLNATREALEGEGASTAESLLARHAAICWLRLAEAETQFTVHTSKSHTLTSGMYYEKRLTLAQRRFTRAVETLARVRALRARVEAAAEKRGGAEQARKAG